jgi:RNA polymerase sigma-70 factor (ECF subfamily)
MQQNQNTNSSQNGRLAALLHAWRAGSEEALGELLISCERYLLLLASQQLESELQAKGGASDLVQETFLEAQRDLPGFIGTTEAELLAWLQKILTNNVANFRRRYRQTAKRRASQEMSLDSSLPAGKRRDMIVSDSTSPSGRAARLEEAEMLNRALEQLTRDYRQVVQLRHQEQLTFKEIGQRMNRSPDAARMLWGRAIERLALIIEKLHVRE